jgi:hypothetical protein
MLEFLNAEELLICTPKPLNLQNAVPQIATLLLVLKC